MTFDVARRARLLSLRLSLALCTSVILLSGCQGVEQLSRPDRGVAMAHPGDWVVTADNNSTAHASDVIFELHHRTQPVRARLRQLATPLIPDAHVPWALLWLDHAYAHVLNHEAQPARIGTAPATHVTSKVADGGQALTEQLWLANDNARTFVLEIWGPAQAVQQTRDSQRIILESIVLSAPAADSTRPQDASAAQATRETALWKVTLPDPQPTDLPAFWLVDQVADNEWHFQLPARLLTIVVLAETLDYPIDATTYGEVALGVAPDSGDLALVGGSDPEVSQASAEVLRTSNGPVGFQILYRFKTSNTRALQLVASTPADLFEQNQGIIAEFFDALGFNTPPPATQD